ncbi:MAG: hypothetical protein QXI19_12445 [Candidatus Caldarchaeum sp.]
MPKVSKRNYKNRKRWVWFLWWVVILIGCASPDPARLVGVWEWKQGSDSIQLTLGSDKRFLREAVVDGKKVLAQGRYNGESNLLVFEDIVESVPGKPGTPVTGTIKVPFEWRGETLVLNPHTLREQPFRRLR